MVGMLPLMSLFINTYSLGIGYFLTIDEATQIYRYKHKYLEICFTVWLKWKVPSAKHTALDIGHRETNLSWPGNCLPAFLYISIKCEEGYQWSFWALDHAYCNADPLGKSYSLLQYCHDSDWDSQSLSDWMWGELHFLTGILNKSWYLGRQ